jgi:hypothetical protein
MKQVSARIGDVFYRLFGRGRFSRALAVFLAMGVVAGCQSIPYDKKGAETVAEYGDTVDRHILAMVSAWQDCKATVPPTTAADCKKGAYASFSKGFYDDWESRLFSAMNQAASGDVLGLCAKAGKLAAEFAEKVSEAALKTGLQQVDMSGNKSCSLATIGGVLQQHRNLRGFHEQFIVLDTDDGRTLRETLAQSVRIALTVEAFKKSAADTGKE